MILTAEALKRYDYRAEAIREQIAFLLLHGDGVACSSCRRLQRVGDEVLAVFQDEIPVGLKRFSGILTSTSARGS